MSKKKPHSLLPEADWDRRINALIDGELSEDESAQLLATAAREPELRRSLEHAQQLQQALLRMPAQRAPRSLRKKLRHIGQDGRTPWSVFTPWWRWGALAALIPLIVMVNIDDTPPAPTAAEIEQGRRDLVIALGYLARAGQKTALEIDSSISSGVLEPITGSTVQALRNQLNTHEELTL